MKDWLGTSYGEAALGNPVHALERGELTTKAFERELAGRLRTVAGGAVEAAGLLTRMFAGFQAPQPLMPDALRRARSVGMRKPEPEIYRLTATRLGVGAAECVFVDDLAPNVRGAVAVGMVAIHHRDAEQTVGELEGVFAALAAGERKRVRHWVVTERRSG